MGNTAELLSQIISADTLSELGKASGASKSEVKSVLTAAVPVLLQGMQNNAGTKSGEASLTKAISDHAADDTSDIAAFFQKADAEDGKKILAHVLGGENDEIQKAVAKKTGVSKSKTGTILALAAPLLLSLLGKTNDNENASGITSLLSLLLGGSGSSADSGSGLGGVLLNTLLGDSSSESASSGTELTGSLLGAILGGGSGSSSGNGTGLVGALLGGDDGKDEKEDKKDAAAELIGGILGNLLK